MGFSSNSRWQSQNSDPPHIKHAKCHISTTKQKKTTHTHKNPNPIKPQQQTHKTLKDTDSIISKFILH